MLLGLQKARVFTMFHVITGCDNVSLFVNKGEKSAMKTWVVSDYADNSLLKMMQNAINISDEDVLNIERFVILMYDRTSQVTSINNAWKHTSNEGISYPTHLPFCTTSKLLGANVLSHPNIARSYIMWMGEII